uniref:Arm_2 domain-containing protein n=1 Tax=Mesocestoides corti TaxID=53468 RepID=A0A5K3G0Z1_MESCO
MPQVQIYVLGLTGFAAGTLGLYFACRHFYESQSRCTRKASKNNAAASPTNSKEQLDVQPTPIPCLSDRSPIDHNHPEVLERLLSLIPTSSTTVSSKIMKTILQMSNFNTNLPLFRSPNILNSLSSLLTFENSSDFSRSINVFVLNLFANIFVDDAVREHLITQMKRFSAMKVFLQHEEESIAFLRLLGNLSMLEDSCVSVREHAPELFGLIGSQSPAVRRQVLTVLLNLSCDAQCIDFLLLSKAPSEFGESVRNLFQDRDDEVIFGKSLKFLCNMYEGLQTHGLAHFPEGSAGWELLVSVLIITNPKLEDTWRF